MWAVSLSFLGEWFVVPHGVGLGLAVLFGALWLAAYWPPLFVKPWLWVVLIPGAFLPLLAIAFVQIPAQALVGQLLMRIWPPLVLNQWLLLAAIPQILLSGIVQEGAKMLPAVFWWWRRNRTLTLRMGLVIGAVAGAAFGTYEAVWTHHKMFMAGWSWQLVQTQGPLALAGIWERFFAMGFHIAAGAISGWGLARGWGWKFYLLAAFLHALLNYSIVLLQARIFSLVQVEIYLAGIAILVSFAVLRLRWRSGGDEDFETA
ncbi:MAG: hypothetical protein ABID87_02820 [Chloroflexota bacterium]